jgi:teichoic acid transport system ATP-binding protein
MPEASETPQRPTAVVAERAGVAYELYVERQRSIRRLLSGEIRERQRQTIDAMSDVSFTAAVGESIGVIGHNGSGKSTLLRTIGGLVGATTGAVRVRSTPVLLDVRAALEPSLSARQNVMLGGAALRIPREELHSRVDEIIAFAGVEEFADVPLRAFSSGMRARLQFAIATARTPKILLIDEALSVGDAEFRGRSNARMREVIQRAGTIFLVSHSMRAVLEVCERVLWMDHGRLVADGPSGAVIDAYHSHVRRLRGAR